MSHQSETPPPIPYGFRPYRRLAQAIVGSAVADFFSKDGFLKAEARLFLFGTGPMFASVVTAKEETMARDEEGKGVPIAVGERYLMVPAFESREQVRDHWFTQAGVGVPSPERLLGMMHDWRARSDAIRLEKGEAKKKRRAEKLAER